MVNAESKVKAAQTAPNDSGTMAGVLLRGAGVTSEVDHGGPSMGISPQRLA